MEEQKKKRGRPRKVVVEPFNPSNLQKEIDAVCSTSVGEGDGTLAAFKDQVTQGIRKPDDHKLTPEKLNEVITKTLYNPYDNPRFKSKNGLDKK